VSAADSGTWRLIAARDFWVRLRERSFLISTLLNVAVISVLVLLAHASGGFGGAPSYDLGAVGGADVVAIANTAASVGGDHKVTVRVHTYPDAGTAEAALRDGSIDAYITRTQIVDLESIDEALSALVQGATHQAAVDALLAKHHISASEQATLNNNAPLAVINLQPAPPDRNENAGVAFIGVLLLYGQLFGYGMWVATGVIEEKSSRIVEMLLSAIRPRQLLAGKIIGIGVLGLAQLITIAGFAIVLALATGAQVVTTTAIWAALLVIGWFMLGYAFYASLFAAAGSLVSRMEELQNVIVPINLTILVSFIISIGSLQDPNSRLAVVASILPVSSALAMPVRIVLGAASGWQIALSLTLLIGSAVALVPVGARLYAGAVLRTGSRVKLRDAWRAA
jgi:ABC-2 type transport system permease protein